jgi:hypothetical protein
MKTRAERQRNAAAAAESVAQKKAHIQAFIDKFRFDTKPGCSAGARQLHAVAAHHRQPGMSVAACCLRC